MTHYYQWHSQKNFWVAFRVELCWTMGMHADHAYWPHSCSAFRSHSKALLGGKCGRSSMLPQFKNDKAKKFNDLKFWSSLLAASILKTAGCILLLMQSFIPGYLNNCLRKLHSMMLNASECRGSRGAYKHHGSPPDYTPEYDLFNWSCVLSYLCVPLSVPF